MTTLFKVENGRLVRAPARPLSRESMIEEWLEENPALIGLDVLIIGKQVETAARKRLDLLALERSGALVIIELKRNQTSRETVAQALDYASWAQTLTTREVYDIASRYLADGLPAAYKTRFGDSIPEVLNTSHSMFIVASELDPASRRIVEYLSEVHGVAINTAFFNVFGHEGEEWLTTDFLLDQAEVEERSERKVRAPWQGYYFVNAGLGFDRSWNDMRRYGFVGASGGDFYTKRLDALSPGDPIFVFQKGAGFIGYGLVTTPKQLASEFETPGGRLFDQPLDQPNVKLNAEDPSMAEYVAGVEWKKTFEVADAKWFKGAFANQNIVCKLRDPATIDFLLQEFEVPPADRPA